MRLVLYGQPRTKKNSPRIVSKPHPRLLPSKSFVEYQNACETQIRYLYGDVRIPDPPVNLRAVYYMETRRRIDLVNLLEATQDILVHAGMLPDDNNQIIASVDGSRVSYDKDNPRVEIEITSV